MKKVFKKTNYIYQLALFTILIFWLAFIYSCTKDDLSNDNVKKLNQVELRSESQSNISLSNDWRDGSYLVFETKDDIKAAYEELKSRANAPSIDSNSITDNSLLDSWEGDRSFSSMRTIYYNYEVDMLEAGFAPEQIKDIPIIDDALATLISVDGLVQVENEIQYFSSSIYAKSPIGFKSRLKQILQEGEPLTPEDVENGIEITVRNPPGCNADFSVDINHSTFEVFVTYTGTPISGGDKQIVWSIDGSEDNKNETGFSHQYGTAGEKIICVTYTETAIVKDTTYFYTKTTRDSSFTKADGQDTTIQIIDVVQHFKVEDVKKVVCIDTYCKTIHLGGCTADFDVTIGIDNVVNFINKSSVRFGEITGYYWTFGDGATSTEVNPTHTYECDKEYTTTLVIYSDQCPGGQASTSRKIDASGLQCCDKNPEGNWKWANHPTSSNKRIKYRYDMGTIWEWLFDQDFKAKIKYYEYRFGGKWPFRSTKWRKTEGVLDVNFDGSVYARDEDGCVCQEARTLEATPITKVAKAHTFVDHLSASAFGTSKTHWMKKESTVFIDYLVDGVLYVRQNCQETPGFHCE